MKFLLFYALLFACFIVQFQSKVSYEVVPGFALEDDWQIQGNAERTDDSIILVQEEGEYGIISNSQKINFEENSYQITVAFNVDISKARGDGMAIWFTESPLQPGDMFGGSPTWNGAGIVLDSIINNERNPIKSPTISIHRNDGSGVSTVESDGENTLATYCITQVRHGVLRLNIVYQDNILSVFTDMEGKNTWRECASFPLRLRNFHFSLSASNKQSAGKYSVYSISVQKIHREIIKPSPDNININNNNNNNGTLSKISKENMEKLQNLVAKSKHSQMTVQRINSLRTSLYLSLNTFNMILVRYVNDTTSRLPLIEQTLNSSFESTSSVKKIHQNQESSLMRLGEKLIPSIRDQLKNRKGKVDILVRDIDSTLTSIDNHLTVSIDRIPKLKFGNDMEEIGQLEVPGFFGFLMLFVPITSIAGCGVWLCRRSKKSNKRHY